MIFLTFLAFLIAASLTFLLSKRAWLLAMPNERSLHFHATPQTGGLAILIALAITNWLIVVLYGAVQGWVWIVSGAGLIAGIALLDDALEIAPLWRLIIQFLSAFFVISIGEINISYLPVFIQTFFIVWMVNLYNFMDGMDGFAGGMAAFGFGTLAILSMDQPFFMALNALIVASSLGFLIFNFPPAKIFMGDTGATVLGFLAATLILLGEKLQLFPFWLGLLAFSPFIVDSTVILFKRLIKREKIWQAHRTHYYQRLARKQGWGHKKTVLWEYVLMASCSISALLMSVMPFTFQMFFLGGWILLYIALIWYLETSILT
jgi:UDP-N-acetylmuramyl pentapeptide phosphotransferase/UDP-N-acetylglucosamine-1-phosphate transferase